jgi:hypothetical protein
MFTTFTFSLRSTALLSLVLFVVTACSDSEFQRIEETAADAQGSAAAVEANLALRWAPVHYQDTDVTGTYSLSGKSDYITAINFDGDWNATNNWNNIANAAAAAHCYYSVVETSTHWFIIYAFFHPRDWSDNPFEYYLGQHENDLEGVLTCVQKDGSTYGKLVAAVTVAHSDFYSFLPAGGSVQANQEDLDGALSFENYNGEAHPVTAQEAKGHGLKANPYYKINGDGIGYYPSLTEAEVPSNANDRDVKYKLVNIFEVGGLWDQRFNTALFNGTDGGGSFKSSFGSGGANAPWAWDDGNDLPGWGELATNPARLIDVYFKNLGSFDLNYSNNRYRGIGTSGVIAQNN